MPAISAGVDLRGSSAPGSSRRPGGDWSASGGRAVCRRVRAIVPKTGLLRCSTAAPADARLSLRLGSSVADVLPVGDHEGTPIKKLRTRTGKPHSFYRRKRQHRSTTVFSFVIGKMFQGFKNRLFAFLQTRLKIIILSASNSK